MKRRPSDLSLQRSLVELEQPFGPKGEVRGRVMVDHSRQPGLRRRRKGGDNASPQQEQGLRRGARKRSRWTWRSAHAYAVRLLQGIRAQIGLIVERDVKNFFPDSCEEVVQFGRGSFGDPEVT